MHHRRVPCARPDGWNATSSGSGRHAWNGRSARHRWHGWNAWNPWYTWDSRHNSRDSRSCRHAGDTRQRRDRKHTSRRGRHTWHCWRRRNPHRCRRHCWRWHRCRCNPCLQSARRAPRRRDAMQQARANVASDTAIATPVGVGNQRDLAHRLRIRVVRIHLHGLVDVGANNFHELVNIPECSGRRTEQVVLIWNKPSMCRRRVGEYLENPNAIRLARLDDIKSNSGAKKASARPLSRHDCHLPCLV